MTATVIRLPIERSARRGSDEARRRHPAGGRRAPVVQLAVLRAERRAVLEAHVEALTHPATGPHWVADAHRAIARFGELLTVGRPDDLIELCDRAIAHLDAAAPDIDDPAAIAELIDHVRFLRVEAWRAPRPG